MVEQRWATGFFVGMVVGGLVGAIAGLLLAPEAGEKTRERLMEKAEELVIEGKKMVGQAVEEAKTRMPHSAS